MPDRVCQRSCVRGGQGEEIERSDAEMTSVVSFAAGKVASAVNAVSTFCMEINPATLSGAIDIIVVKRGEELYSSPFYVRFGKLKLLRPHEKTVEVIVNDRITNLAMKVDEAGEVFFNPDKQIYEDDYIVEEDQANSIFKGDTKNDELSNEEGELENLTSSLERIQFFDSPITYHPGYEYRNFRVRGQSFTSSISNPSNEYSLFSQAGILASVETSDLYIRLSHHKDLQASSSNSRTCDSFFPNRRFSLPSLLTTDENSSDYLETSQSPVGVSHMEDKTDSSYSWDSIPGRKEIPCRSLNFQNKNTTYDCKLSSPSNNIEDIKLQPHTSTQISQDSLPKDIIDRVLNRDKSVEVSSVKFNKIKHLNNEVAHALFNKYKLNFDSFLKKISSSKNYNFVVRIDGKIYDWKPLSKALLLYMAFGEPLASEQLLQRTYNPKDNTSRSNKWWIAPLKSSKKVEIPVVCNDQLPQKDLVTSSTRKHKQNESSVQSRSPYIEKSEPSKYDNSILCSNQSSKLPIKSFNKPRRMVCPTSDQLKQLGLRYGLNNVIFRVKNSGFQGTAACSARIFMWDQDDKVVISDIDGTITKSDALGYIFNMVGKDWTHLGVANLYTNIEKNGYKILYLTSRSLGQANSTREYLENVRQAGCKLPAGPVIMSPDRLFTSFHREIISKRPHDFKMASLMTLKRLFGEKKPFYAGFGNRITDALSYRSVDIPVSRIFTINPLGEVRLELLLSHKLSYFKINDLVDQIFPSVESSLVDRPEYNDWNFWKNRLPQN